MTLKIVAETQKSSADIAWDRIRGLKSVILAHGREGDVIRRLPDPIIQAFVDADLYRLHVPKDLGGLGLDPLTTFDLTVELSTYDGSVGWNFGVGISGPTLIGGLPLETLKMLFESADCGIAATGAPPGRAVVVDGGYKVSGRWAWGSGIHQSSWVAGGVFVYDGDKPRLEANGKPGLKFMVLRKDQAQVLDTWQTGGMRGTGSTDWEASDLFVPESQACAVNSSQLGHPAPIFRTPSSYFGMAMCAVAVGIAKGTVEAFKEFVANDRSGVRNQGYAQYAVARAEALYEAGHLNVRESFRPLWESALEHQPPTMADRTRVRRSYVHAVESAVEAVTLCYNAAGGAAIHEANPFHRALRDVYAVNAHRALSRRFMEMAGQAAFGLSPDNPLF